MAKDYLQTWISKVSSALDLAQYASDKGQTRDAAFLLHQAVERAYIAFLLVYTFYFPRSHNIKFLRSLAEDIDKRLIEAWPRDNRLDRRRFEALKRAYVEARYSDQYEISLEDLQALTVSARRLEGLVTDLCADRLDALAAGAGTQ